MTGQSLARTSASGLDRLRQQFAPKATDEDLAYFAEVCRHLEVDPWAGHICLIGRLDRTTGEMVHKPQLMVAGRRYIAQRTTPPDRRADVVRAEGLHPRRPAHRRAGDSEPGPGSPPYAARCLVYRDDWDRPANGTVKWSEFAQTFQPRGGGDRQPTPTWAQMPSHMLGKVAESLALRRAFAEVESAIAVIGADDDTALMAEVDAEGYIQPVPDPPDGVPAAYGLGRPDIGAEYGPADPPAPPAGSDALEDRLMALPDSARVFFRAWRRSRAYGWPPADAKILAEMSATVDRLEEDLAADADTYGDDPL